MNAKPKEKRCPICDQFFTPWMTTQHVCSNYQCALAWNKKQDERLRERAERRRLRTRSAFKQKSWADINNEAQKAFNRYIRIRDQGRPCHACGCLLNDNNPNKPGQFVDASHYRSRSAAAQLRFNVFNCVTCCWTCNRELSGNARNLRKGLIYRFGLSVVIRLELDNSFHHHSVRYLMRLTDIFTRRADQLLQRRRQKELA